MAVVRKFLLSAGPSYYRCKDATTVLFKAASTTTTLHCRKTIYLLKFDNESDTKGFIRLCSATFSGASHPLLRESTKEKWTTVSGPPDHIKPAIWGLPDPLEPMKKRNCLDSNKVCHMKQIHWDGSDSNLNLDIGNVSRGSKTCTPKDQLLDPVEIKQQSNKGQAKKFKSNVIEQEEVLNVAASDDESEDNNEEEEIMIDYECANSQDWMMEFEFDSDTCAYD
eukprot:jgi/Psemu1/26433/gm1.26433_g